MPADVEAGAGQAQPDDAATTIVAAVTVAHLHPTISSSSSVRAASISSSNSKATAASTVQAARSSTWLQVAADAHLEERLRRVCAVQDLGTKMTAALQAHHQQSQLQQQQQLKLR